MKPFTQDLFYGLWGIEVYKLQDYLESIGYGDFVPTGFFGTKTMEAVRTIQVDNKIEPTSGYFGPKTRNLINTNKINLDREKIYNTALSLLHTDVTPDDAVPDEVDCADTVTHILQKAGFDIGIFTLTTNLYKKLSMDAKWRRVYSPLRGDIIVSPTGYGNGFIPNGHVGICGNGGKIMSNSSATGTLEENYNIETWYTRYGRLGGYPVYYYRKI